MKWYDGLKLPMRSLKQRGRWYSSYCSVNKYTPKKYLQVLDRYASTGEFQEAFISTVGLNYFINSKIISVVGSAGIMLEHEEAERHLQALTLKHY